MAHRAAAHIILGGTITASMFAGLLEVLEEDGLTVEAEAVVFGRPLRLADDEVVGGEFARLESYCVDHGLPFVRWAGACPGVFDAERVVFTGRGEPYSCTADEDDRVLLTRDTVELLGSYAAVIAYFDGADFSVPPLILKG